MRAPAVAFGLEVGGDRQEVGVQVVVGVFGVGRVDVGQEVVVVIPRHIDRGRQPLVGNEREAVFTLELRGDRLDERIFVKADLNPAANRLDELEELLRLPLLLVGEEDVRVDLGVAFMEFVVVHLGVLRYEDRMDGEYTFGSVRGPW